jgi:hypothetical protein
MEYQLFIATLQQARDCCKKDDYPKAIKLYDSLYQDFVDGYHQYFDYYKYLSDEAHYSQDYTQRDKERARFFVEILDEYTRALILFRYPKFNLDESELYQSMISFNTLYKCKYVNGRYKAIADDPYPYYFKILTQTYSFKTGPFKNFQLWEIDLIAPLEIISMVGKVPKLCSDSNVDLAVHQQFFLSKHRNRDFNFFSALQINYVKIKASHIWHDRWESMDFRCDRLQDQME